MLKNKDLITSSKKKKQRLNYRNETETKRKIQRQRVKDEDNAIEEDEDYFLDVNLIHMQTIIIFFSYYKIQDI